MGRREERHGELLAEGGTGPPFAKQCQRFTAQGASTCHGAAAPSSPSFLLTAAAFPGGERMKNEIDMTRRGHI
jgi:hypothetical protein